MKTASLALATSVGEIRSLTESGKERTLLGHSPFHSSAPWQPPLGHSWLHSYRYCDANNLTAFMGQPWSSVSGLGSDPRVLNLGSDS